MDIFELVWQRQTLSIGSWGLNNLLYDILSPHCDLIRQINDSHVLKYLTLIHFSLGFPVFFFLQLEAHTSTSERLTPVDIYEVLERRSIIFLGVICESLNF